MEKRLQRRMYFFVPYNLSPIQQAIQAGHASLEYAWKFFNMPEFRDFIQNDKTWVILNGGTTNDTIDSDGCYYGSLNQLEVELITNSIPYSNFIEPDLNNALTALCFICDEKVFNRKDYPDFLDYILDVKMSPGAKAIMDKQNISMLRRQTPEHIKELFSDWYPQWVEFLGGERNVFLRNLIKDKKLA